MAADAWITYASLAEKVGNKLIDFDTDDFKMALILDGYTPDQAADDEYADISGDEHASQGAPGYVTGGFPLTGVAWTRTGATSKFTSNYAQWTATGGSIVCKYAVIYDDTVAGKPLVAYCLLDNSPADVTVTVGNILKITPSATGIFTEADANA
jgi:hypothetical protein